MLVFYLDLLFYEYHKEKNPEIETIWKYIQCNRPSKNSRIPQ